MAKHRAPSPANGHPTPLRALLALSIALWLPLAAFGTYGRLWGAYDGLNAGFYVTPICLGVEIQGDPGLFDACVNR